MSSEFRCNLPSFRSFRLNDDDIITASSEEQDQIENAVEKCYSHFQQLFEIESEDEHTIAKIEMFENMRRRSYINLKAIVPLLDRQRHRAFLVKGLKNLSESYESLDASRPWLCYWILHGLELLGTKVDAEVADGVVEFLSRCQHPEGGYGGGPGQFAHLAPTYAAVSALCIIGTERAYQSINRYDFLKQEIYSFAEAISAHYTSRDDEWEPASCHREKLASFLMRVRLDDGSYVMHEGGEVDIRGAYCAAVAARLTGVATKEMFDGTSEWIIRCQTYEGGFAGCPGLEAHGGYSYCGLAALILLGKPHLCDLQSLLADMTLSREKLNGWTSFSRLSPWRWTACRQMSLEGGFQGRTNKLVDGCYSFWQGGAFPLIHSLLAKQGDEALSVDKWMFEQGALQEYILICCQSPGGGLIDKPGKSRDFYHTSYCLSGLSVAQHFAEGMLSSLHVIGPEKVNELVRHSIWNYINARTNIHTPLFNIGLEAVQNAHIYFESLVTSSSTKDKSTVDDLNSIDNDTCTDIQDCISSERSIVK